MLIKDRLVAANDAYRQGSPIMSDQEFDDLLEEYGKTIPSDEFVLFKNSLHETKGKVKHPFIMGSLEKVKMEEPTTIKKFIDKHIHNKINVSAKVDGISCRLHYEKGKLVSATTRGDGTFGEDITNKIWFVKNVPHDIGTEDTIDFRGELVILSSDFEKISDKFANPRNATAGIINRKDFNKEDISNISFIAYTILGDANTKHMQFVCLKLFGFHTAFAIELDKSDPNLLETLNKLANDKYEYGIDGLVVCDSEYINEDKYRPDACVALKINQLQSATRLIDIDWEGPTKDGHFIPVGLVEPVELGGSTISRVTLHNLDFIEEKGLMYGCELTIVKSGDIIPKVLKVLNCDSSCVKIDPIETCPNCQSSLVRDGVNMKCPNEMCSSKVLTEIYSFIRKMGVKSATQKTLSKFGIDSFVRLADFKANPKYKSEVKLEAEIYSKIFTRSKKDLISAMNFGGIADKILDKIFENYGFETIEKHIVVDNNGKMSCDVLSLRKDFSGKSLPVGVGMMFMEKFYSGISGAIANASIFFNHEKYHCVTSSIVQETTNVVGYIVVTGTLSSGSRSSFLKKAREFGWESQGAVNKKTTYLINNDISSNSSKNKKAKELGVKIISEDEFLKLLSCEETDLDLL